jgi:hypothetical protein
MEGVNLKRAMVELPLLCLSLMQHVSKEEQEALGKQVALLKKNGMDDEQNAIMLGILLSRVTGIRLLKAAAADLKQRPPVVGYPMEATKTEISEILKRIESPRQ